jgi:hypothetical protein
MFAYVIISSALICFQGQCHPVLLGSKTPMGVFQVKHMATTEKGYYGDILVFSENEKSVLAIHRVWLLKPSEHRAARLKNPNPEQRKNITHGCINVSLEVYDKLKDLTELEIRKN